MTEAIASFPIASVTLTDASPGDEELNPARFIVDRENGQANYIFRQAEGETIVYQVDMTRLLARRNTGLESVSFTVELGDVTIDAAQLASGKARVKLTNGSSRIAQIKMLAIQDDGSNRIVYIKLERVN